MKTYQSVLPAATRIPCKQQIQARVKANLHKLCRNGFWYCRSHEGTCERVESDQGKPATCDVCGSIHIEWNPPLWVHEIEESKLIAPADLKEQEAA